MSNDKTAIVTLGGAYKATYYTGVLRALHELGINNFDMYLGASSGAPALAYFMAGQQEDMEHIWTNYIPSKKLYNINNIFNNKPILNLDYLVNEIFEKIIPLNLEKIKNIENKLIIPVLNYKNGDVEYMSDKEEDFFTILKATMSIPWINGKYYKINDNIYIDAGIGGRPPIKKILDEGYTKILLLTPDIKKSLVWRRRFFEYMFFLLSSNISKNIIQKLKNENNLNEKVLDYHIKNPGYTKIVVISPSQNTIGRFENNKNKIQKSIDLGYRDVMNNELLKKDLEIFRK
ncbi:MAG: patatin-like phospholipase family protein [Patescibacteria group bacterium]|nr:patatin-like phospholipase family protein [Patescibacteria group bacterium]MDD4304368.1 patatin-like phospholipase family protein [Patescibacteria group bacterium]MDD4695391.1 patatin-like phospholipase family protein [Patescibacteria group bacterium]